MVERHLVTGGAGFIGSHLVDRLLADGHEVVVYDNFSAGKKEFLAHQAGNPRLRILEGDVTDRARLVASMRGSHTVWHLAANPDVRVGESDARVHLDQNVVATYGVLEAVREANVKRFGFTSTSTVYGVAAEIPTPETYGPCYPISLYGASKLAAEAMISGFAYTFDIQAVAFRFANVVGSRSTHGVTYDFYHKLRKEPGRLTILGDGQQLKSYVHVSDTVDGMMQGMRAAKGHYEAFNIGSTDAINVVEIADRVTRAMGLHGVKYEFTGGAAHGGGGWKGDVKVMRLDASRLMATGWRPKMGSGEAISATAESLVRDG